MDFFRLLKKDSTVNESGAAALGESASEADSGGLKDLWLRVAGLGQSVGQLQELLGAFLTRQSETSAAAVGAMAGRLEAWETTLQLLRQRLDDLSHGDHQLVEEMRRLYQGIQSRLDDMAEAAHPAKPAAKTPTNVGGDWQQALLGPELSRAPGIDAQRQALLAGLLSGEPAACSLLGQLLLFQSATVEKMPPLLKDIGEAFYRWQPKTRPGASPMEGALVQWLRARCERAGIPNQIETVEPGERFDMQRHNANSRGVEISEVHGWVVVRDSGKVYTKASVTIK